MVHFKFFWCLVFLFFWLLVKIEDIFKRKENQVLGSFKALQVRRWLVVFNITTLCFKAAYFDAISMKKKIRRLKLKTQWLAPPCCYTTSQAQAQAQAHSEASSSSSPQPQLSQPLSSFSSTYPPPLTSSPIIIHLTHPFQASILHLGLQLSLPLLAKPSLFHFTIIPKHPFNFKCPKLFIWEKEDLEVNALQNLDSPQTVMVCQCWFFLLLGLTYLSESISVVCVCFF